jgi:hypothetical protein
MYSLAYNHHTVRSALGQVLAPALEGLLANHGAPVAFHRRVVGGDELRRHHAFQLVLRPDTDQRRESSAALLISRLLVGVVQPKGLNRLVRKNVVPVIGT